MGKLLTAFVFVFLICGCKSGSYMLFNPTHGVDFSDNGKWLLGEIEVNPNVKENFTILVLKNFSEHVGDRIKYAPNDRSLLVSSKTPLDLKKHEILTLKKGTGYDYFINIKCRNSSTDTSADLINKDYYIKDLAFALVTVEVYDLNKGEIVYSQTARGTLDRSASLSLKPTAKVITNCFDKIMADMLKKSIVN